MTSTLEPHRPLRLSRAVPALALTAALAWTGAPVLDAQEAQDDDRTVAEEVETEVRETVETVKERTAEEMAEMAEGMEDAADEMAAEVAGDGAGDATEIEPFVRDFVPGRQHPDAPPEIEHFGQLVGIWDVELQPRHQDGTWGEERMPAEWRFYYILDGHAIQDDWISPPLGTAIPEGGNRQFGTNIRIYNPAEERWEMAWISKGDQKVSNYKATYDDGAIRMEGIHGTGRPAKITFYDITEDTFRWKIEFDLAAEGEEASWMEVGRIEGKRRR